MSDELKHDALRTEPNLGLPISPRDFLNNWCVVFVRVPLHFVLLFISCEFPISSDWLRSTIKCSEEQGGSLWITVPSQPTPFLLVGGSTILHNKFFLRERGLCSRFILRERGLCSRFLLEKRHIQAWALYSSGRGDETICYSKSRDKQD